MRMTEVAPAQSVTREERLEEMASAYMDAVADEKEAQAHKKELRDAIIAEVAAGGLPTKASGVVVLAVTRSPAQVEVVTRQKVRFLPEVAKQVVAGAGWPVDPAEGVAYRVLDAEDLVAAAGEMVALLWSSDPAAAAVYDARVASVVEVVPVEVTDGLVEKLAQEGRLTLPQVQQCFETVPEYALSVKKTKTDPDEGSA